MELQEFVEKFLQNYEEIEKEALIVEKEACSLAGIPYTSDEENSAKYKILVEHFPEALQNFTDEIRQAQIEFAQRWIPVEEKLPEQAQEVIMKSEGKIIAGFYEYATFRNHDGELIYHVTDWRPIELK